MFRLQKWYMDVVSDSGDVLIAYSALLELGSLRIPYSALLDAPAGGSIHERRSFRPVEAPQCTAPDRIGWSHRRLGVHGQWTGPIEHRSRRFFESETGFSAWTGLQQRADASVAVNGRLVHGTGYTERVELTAAPWKIPMSVLYWGRFHSTSVSLIWVYWDVPDRIALLLYNGRETGLTRVDDGTVAGPDGTLRLDRGRLLRGTSLGEGALNRVPGLKHVVPGMFLKTREAKWLSRGTFRDATGREETGWAIHETVHFER